jgi:raffinose/stachyose/melibiose transport system substrate-binding protein
MKKVFTSVTVISACMVVLSACGNTSGTSSSSSPSASTPSSSTAAPTAAAKKITLTMMVSGTKNANGEDFVLDTLPKLVHQKFPNVTLETQKLPDDQYNTSVKTKLAAGEGPDIFLEFPKIGTMGAIDMAKAGYAADLSDLTFWNNIGKSAKDDMSFEGKPYAVAQGMDILGTYYNKDLFQKAGITSLPKDWDSFLADCQKLKDAGVTPIVMGDKDSWWIQFGLYQIAANTVYPDDKAFDTKLQAGQEALTSPKWVKAISMYKELYDKGYIVKNSLGIGSAQANQMFNDGKAAMVLDGTWDYSALTTKGAVDFQRGFFPLPANEKGKPTWMAAATASGYGINAKSANIAAVKEIFNYWFDGKSDLFQAWVKSGNSISSYNGVPLNQDLFKDAVTQYQSGNAIYFSNQMWPAGVAEQLQAKFSEIIGGKSTTPEEVAKSMQEKFKQTWKN